MNNQKNFYSFTFWKWLFSTLCSSLCHCRLLSPFRCMSYLLLLSLFSSFLWILLIFSILSLIRNFLPSVLFFLPLFLPLILRLSHPGLDPLVLDIYVPRTLIPSFLWNAVHTSIMVPAPWPVSIFVRSGLHYEL